MSGTDLHLLGIGSIVDYDNSFNPSLLNGEEMEDFLVLQRDFESRVDCGTCPRRRDL